MAENDVALIDAFIKAKERADTAQMAVADLRLSEQMLAGKLAMIGDCLDHIEAMPDVLHAVPTSHIRMWLRWLAVEALPRRFEAQMEEVQL